MDRRPTIMSANILFLACTVLLLGFSGLMLPMGWRLTLNELALIGLPLVLYLLITKVPVRPTLQLKPTSTAILAVSFVTGIGFYLFDRWVVIVVTELVDYVPAYTPDLLQSNAFSAVLTAIGVVILAPLFEEALFRGVLQSAYARWGGLAAVVFPGLLFALFHMDPTQTLFLVPLALVLSWVAWRTGSIWAAVAMHLGNNLFVGVLTLLSEFAPGFTMPQDTIITAATGLTVVFIGLVVLNRIMPRRRVEVDPEDRRLWLLKLWPLGIAVPITAGLVVLTAFVGLFPELLSFGLPVTLEGAPWEEAQTWEYDIFNMADEPVGEATCTVSPGASTVTLECEIAHEGFEVDTSSGYWQMSARDEHLLIVWDAETLNIVEGRVTGSREGDAEYEVLLEAASEDELTIVVSEDGEIVTEGFVPADSVLGGERVGTIMMGDWPWRYSALPFSVLMSGQTTVVGPFSVPLIEREAVVVRTADLFPTATGDVITWRVSLGDEYTAWYSADEPHTLVGYSDDMVRWVLRE
ncbi:MAG: type II CAAX endopeptidase family protein [Aggregatilineales bacterium]|nr:type II CAAX endopeptidase family protein [Aggregatilineales bacterium]HPV06046.1 type II CAAX endopeptidase family protein [Aggregatilineales bacterium]